jgi:hypothetical protein
VDAVIRDRPGVPALTEAALLAHSALSLTDGLPWLAVTIVYTAFHRWSYRELVETGPRLAAALKKAAGRAPSG